MIKLLLAAIIFSAPLGETPLDRHIRQQNDRIDNSICQGC